MWLSAVVAGRGAIEASSRPVDESETAREGRGLAAAVRGREERRRVCWPEGPTPDPELLVICKYIYNQIRNHSKKLDEDYCPDSKCSKIFVRDEADQAQSWMVKSRDQKTRST